MELNVVNIKNLNSKARENYNFAKISAVLADYGYVTMRLSNDWQGADFIAQHNNGEDFLKIQLKSRMAFSKKYIGKNIYIVFPDDNDWYLYHHDAFLEVISASMNLQNTKSWINSGSYHFPHLSVKLREALQNFKISPGRSPNTN